MTHINNINVESFEKLITPNELIKQIPTNDKICNFVKKTRNEIIDILDKKDNRKILIVGPCSIHNTDEAKIYAMKLKDLQEDVQDKILIIMRVYFEKPRTTTGWKGLINDPDLNDTYDIKKGLYKARELLKFLAEIEIGCAYEVLDTFTPQYISDLICWSAIGARTTESQIHRQLVSGLSMPVGYKNNTDGNTKVALDGIISSRYPHCFYGITYDGEGAIVKTNGNKNCHLILRGGNNGPNFYKEDVDKVLEEYENMRLKYDLTTNIMIDCSHGNSLKDYKNQSKVWQYIMCNYLFDENIIGYMLESNINEGSQKKSDELKYGVSITDSCISFQETYDLVHKMFNYLTNLSPPNPDSI